jgi:hypothetical protein
MRLREFAKIFESSDTPYRDTDLPLSDYRGPYNPRSDDLSNYGDDYQDATTLWNVIDDLINDGVKPQVVDIAVDTLLATQDWLSSEPGDGPMWDEFGDKPVVLDYQGKRYILDGHNRISRQRRTGRKSMPVYYFSGQ